MWLDDYFPYSVNVELTRKCNLKCVHCGSTSGNPLPDELDTETFEGLFRDLKTLGCREICLLGGEPFVRPDWFDIAKYINVNGMAVLFITNGYNFSTQILNKLKKLDSVARIGVSLDSAHPEEHDMIRGRKGSFDRAWQAAQMLRDAGFETGIITTLSKFNIIRFGDLKDKLHKQQLTWQIQIASPHGERFDRSHMLSLAEFYETGRTISYWRNTIPIADLPVCGSHDIGYFSTQFSNYSELPDWHGCGAGLYTLGIMSDGGVKGCLCQNDDFVEGNIREQSIIDIWRDADRFARNRKFHAGLLEGDCKDCPHGTECRAGCSNLSYNLTGSTYNNPYCLYGIERRGDLHVPAEGA